MAESDMEELSSLGAGQKRGLKLLESGENLVLSEAKQKSLFLSDKL